jgi:hypothetical protein
LKGGTNKRRDYREASPTKALAYRHEDSECYVIEGSYHIEEAGSFEDVKQDYLGRIEEVLEVPQKKKKKDEKREEKEKDADSSRC